VDFGLCCHIDAACGFVNNEEFGLEGHPSGKHNLLLVATGQVVHFLLGAGHFDAHPIAVAGDQRVFCLCIDQAHGTRQAVE